MFVFMLIFGIGLLNEYPVMLSVLFFSRVPSVNQQSPKGQIRGYQQYPIFKEDREGWGVEGNCVVLVNDLIEFNQMMETLTLCFSKKIGRSTFQKQIDFLKHHTDYPKPNANIGGSELIGKYKAKKRVLKFIHLSRILNIQLDNDVFSISSMILQMQGQKDKQTWQQELALLAKQNQQRKNGNERTTNQETFKRTFKKTRSKQKSKQKNKLEGKKIRSLSKLKKN